VLLAPGRVFGQEQSLDTRVDAYLAPYVKGNSFLGAVLIAQGDRILDTRYIMSITAWLPVITMAAGHIVAPQKQASINEKQRDANLCKSRDHRNLLRRSIHL